MSDISVILSTRNRVAILVQELASFANLDLDGMRVEFLVIDNGSDDSTQDALGEWQQRLNLYWWTEPRPGKNICLNQAVERARGELLVFTDDDVIADPGWLQEFRAAAERWPNHSIFGGAIEPRFSVELPVSIQSLEQHFGVLYSRYHPADQEGVVERPPFGPNLMIRRRVFENYRYNESIGPSGAFYAMGSETELLQRLKEEQCLDYVFVPSARVQHIIRDEQTNLEWVQSRAFRAGRGGARFMKSRYSKIGKVPWPLWGRLAIAKFSATWNEYLGGEESRARAAWQLQKFRGYVYELRSEQSRQASESKIDGKY